MAFTIKDILTIIQIVISLLLIVVILLQAQGEGLGVLGGQGGEFFQSKRGIEKLLFRTTIVLASLFFVSSIIQLLIK
ncbi:preprotein translocase subunit SecG [Candidatus Shapirobacteria bacterium]|nr:preprotein translocase subunit SecG [Candidatus Shapirobacteria bacterium]